MSAGFRGNELVRTPNTILEAIHTPQVTPQVRRLLSVLSSILLSLAPGSSPGHSLSFQGRGNASRRGNPLWLPGLRLDHRSST